MNAPQTPSPSLIAHLVRELVDRSPFAHMAHDDVADFARSCTETYYAPGEVILAPGHGVVTHLLCIRRGEVSSVRGGIDAGATLTLGRGELFPVGAALGERPVTGTYTAAVDTFCLTLPVADLRRLAQRSAVFAAYLNERVAMYLEHSRRAMQALFASQTLAEQSLEAPLGRLAPRTPVTVTPDTPIEVALRLMHERRIGSVLVAGGPQGVQGILTRHDVLGRVVLPRLPLDTPIERVMSHPLATLGPQDTALDAAMLMSRRGIRHVPVCDDGRVVNIVSERDLFAMQKLSLKHVSSSIRGAGSLDELQVQAQAIRAFARNLLGQGVQARQLTEIVTQLNDLLAERLITLVAAARGIDLSQGCWLAFGSEGRGEQTIATDQDNGLVFASDDPARDRPAWLAFAEEVNQGLAACGYPLCKGGVMASNPQGCLSTAEWLERFESWMEHGSPEDLLKASIYFDLRPIAGQAALAAPLRQCITQRPASLPRFIKQLAVNALQHRPPLNWLGAVQGQRIEGRPGIDLKLHGTAVFVDAARIYALAHGLDATSTRSRLQGFAQAAGVPAREGDAWIVAFEFLQALRLRTQLAAPSGGVAGAEGRNPNALALDELNDIDLRMLKESLRLARQLQQRLELDYQR